VCKRANERIALVSGHRRCQEVAAVSADELGRTRPSKPFRQNQRHFRGQGGQPGSSDPLTVPDGEDSSFAELELIAGASADVGAGAARRPECVPLHSSAQAP